MDDKDTVTDLGIFFPVVISIRCGALPEKVTYYSWVPWVIQSYTCTREQGMQKRVHTLWRRNIHNPSNPKRVALLSRRR